MITDVSVDMPATARDKGFCATAKLDLMGEIMRDARARRRFQRGVADYPAIGDSVAMMSNAELRVIYEMSGSGTINIGHLQQDRSIGGYINGNEMVGKHFAVLGTTGVGKSTGVAIILQRAAASRVRTCASSCSTPTTNTAASSATTRRCSSRATSSCRSGCSISRRSSTSSSAAARASTRRSRSSPR